MIGPARTGRLSVSGSDILIFFVWGVLIGWEFYLIKNQPNNAFMPTIIGIGLTIAYLVGRSLLKLLGR